MLTVLAGKREGGKRVIMLVEAACVWCVCVCTLLLKQHTCSARIEGNSTEMMLVNAASSEEG